MANKLDSEKGRALYRPRQQTVESVFGVIKAVLGFTGFSLRGLDKGVRRVGLPAQAHADYGVMTAFLARQIDANGSTQPASAGNRCSIDRSKPILAISSNVDRAAGRRQPNHSKSESDPKIRQTARNRAAASRAGILQINRHVRSCPFGSSWTLPKCPLRDHGHSSIIDQGDVRGLLETKGGCNLA